MIRPLTIVSCLLAFGSGLYLYQSKHEVQLLDRTIERTVHETSALRDQSRLLVAEWNMLNNFDRLREFSDTYLKLEPIKPAQFTSVADLANRLPPVRAEVPVPATDEQQSAPIVGEAVPQPVPEPAQIVAADEVLPVPPIPAVASLARPTDAKTPERRPFSGPAGAAVAESQPHSAVSQPRPVVLAAPRPMPVTVPISAPFNPPARVAVNVLPAPMPSRPAMVATAGLGSPGPYGGSLLGMARGSMPPTPRPTPVSATYNTN
jgi:hypothetical protein